MFRSSFPFYTLLVPSYLKRKNQRARLGPPVKTGLPIPVLMIIIFILTYMIILPLSVFTCSHLPPSTAPASGASFGLFSHLINRLTHVSNGGICLALRYSFYWPLVRSDLLERQEQIIMRDLDEHRNFLGMRNLDILLQMLYFFIFLRKYSLYFLIIRWTFSLVSPDEESHAISC